MCHSCPYTALQGRVRYPFSSNVHMRIEEYPRLMCILVVGMYAVPLCFCDGVLSVFEQGYAFVCVRVCMCGCMQVFVPVYTGVCM